MSVGLNCSSRVCQRPRSNFSVKVLIDELLVHRKMRDVVALLVGREGAGRRRSLGCVMDNLVRASDVVARAPG